MEIDWEGVRERERSGRGAERREVKKIRRERDREAERALGGGNRGEGRVCERWQGWRAWKGGGEVRCRLSGQ